MDCSYAAEQGCCEACEKAKQDCLWVKSEDLDICRYKCMPQPGQAVSANQDACLRTCDRNWRAGNADCRDAADTCVAQNCQRTYGTCREDCLDYTEDCYNQCESDIELALDQCAGNPNCESEAKRRYRAAKDACRDAFTKCDNMCDSDSRDLCFIECEKVKQKGLMDCDRALDDCNANVILGKATATDCSRARRVCEANVRDGADWCNTQCAGSYDTDLAACKVCFPVIYIRHDLFSPSTHLALPPDRDNDPNRRPCKVASTSARASSRRARRLPRAVLLLYPSARRRAARATMALLLLSRTARRVPSRSGPLSATTLARSAP